MLSGLTGDGLLPPGVHDTGWSEFKAAFGHNQWRQTLLGGLQRAAVALASAGCTALWIDGSFVTDREYPGDYDACWDWHGVEAALLDPVLLDYSSAGRAAMRAKYLGDIFIAGVEGGSGLTFVEFFQRTRDGHRKGIVQLDPRGVK